MAETLESAESILMGIDRDTNGAWNKSRTAVPDEEGFSLPDGITGGIARMVNFAVKKNEKGIPIIRFTFMVVTPEEFEGQKVHKSFYIEDGEYGSREEALDKVSFVLQHCRCDISNAKLADLPKHLKDAAKRRAAVRYDTWTPPSAKKAAFLPKGPASEEHPDMDGEGGTAEREPDEHTPPPVTRARGSKTQPKHTRSMEADIPDFADAPPEDESESSLPDFGDEDDASAPYVPKVNDVVMIETKKGPHEVKITKVDLKKETFSAMSVAKKTELHNLPGSCIILDA